VHAREGLDIGWRSITVSTCGILPEMERLSEDYPQVNLAVSLHGPNDEIRDKLIPMNKKWPMAELLRACRKHTELTGRRITFEYALIKGVNDSPEHGEELARRLGRMLCHVNLIPLNKVEENKLHGSDRKKAEEFKKQLEAKGIPVTIRREMGADIDAACGQLRNLRLKG